jgi:hypothetical protein
MFTIRGGLAERLGFDSFSINLDTATLYDSSYSNTAVLATTENGFEEDPLQNSDIVIINPRAARKK